MPGTKHMSWRNWYHQSFPLIRKHMAFAITISATAIFLAQSPSLIEMLASAEPPAPTPAPSPSQATDMVEDILAITRIGPDETFSYLVSVITGLCNLALQCVLNATLLCGFVLAVRGKIPTVNLLVEIFQSPIHLFRLLAATLIINSVLAIPYGFLILATMFGSESTTGVFVTYAGCMGGLSGMILSTMVQTLFIFTPIHILLHKQTIRQALTEAARVALKQFPRLFWVTILYGLATGTFIGGIGLILSQIAGLEGTAFILALTPLLMGVLILLGMLFAATFAIAYEEITHMDDEHEHESELPVS